MTICSKMRVHVFGNLAVSQGGTPVALPASVAPVIAYLVIKRARPVPRSEVAGMIWADRTEGRARRCLSTALWRLNHDPHTSGMVDTSHHDVLRLNPHAAFWVDAVAFEYRIETLLAVPAEGLSDQQYRRLVGAVDLYCDDLMQACDYDWAQIERQRLRHLYLAALFHVTAAADSRGDTSAAIAYGRRLTALEPLREDAHRMLMRIYAASGNRGKAIEQYRICQGELSTELNVDPTLETQALYASLIGEGGEAMVPSAADRRAASLDAISHRVRYARRVLAAADLRLADALNLVNRASRINDHP